ncbi:DUF305 domain-containing protein [Streptomyces sp. NPDC001848]|uniref:DUF305 domain-containing protein n=1 Tax=Streptomyces sp. NPDC001848 TaxID=3364618 RepID=UPI0036A3BDC6
MAAAGWAVSSAARSPAAAAPTPRRLRRVETLSAEEAGKRRAEDDTPNAADFSYARMMIDHHRQALEMTQLAPRRAESDAVKRLAERITAAQQPEIASLEAWLTAHAKEDHGSSHQHDPMPGMATEAQLKRLRAAEGKAFDELFLKLMITHHGGAVTMAADVKAEGNNIRIEEMADDVIAQQTSEMSRMRQML